MCRVRQNNKLQWEGMMSLRQFGFMDEDFLKDAFDLLTRRSLMIGRPTAREVWLVSMLHSSLGSCVASWVWSLPSRFHFW